MSYIANIVVPFSKDRIFHFFYDIERLLRLNPQWGILSIDKNITALKGFYFKVKVRYDRSEQEIEYLGIIEEFVEGSHLTLRLFSYTMPRLFRIKVLEDGARSIIEYEEIRDEELSTSEKNEINLWLKCIVNYINVMESNSILSKVWRYFFDKAWLRMTPAGRRLVFFIVLIEILGLFFFFLFLIYLLIF